MKSLKMILAATAVVAFGSLANAQTTIHITGSTAFRAAAHKSIIDALNAGTPSVATYGYVGTSLSSAGQAIFTQTNYANTGATVIVKTSWSGSVGGLQVLTKSYTVPNTINGVVGGWLVNSTPQSTGGTPNAPSTFDTPAVTADASFSDSFQSSTSFLGANAPTSPVLTGANGYTDGIVAVVPFEWVAGNGYPSDLSNVTGLALQNALPGGTTLAQFTGVPADNAFAVEVIGRDSDSGTRLEAFAETQFGTGGSPTQYEPEVVGGVITQLNFWPAQNTDGIPFPSGHEGYSSGSGVAGALNTPGASSSAGDGGPAYIIGYLGISDAATVTTGKILTYDGAAYSPLTVENGQYSFWAYEHVYYRPTYGGTGKTVVDAIAADVHNVTANTSVSGILVTSMNVSRTIEGGPISLGNPF